MVRDFLRDRAIRRLGLAAAVAVGLALPARADTAAAPDNGPCASMAKELVSQIEEMKKTRAAGNQLRAPVDPKVGDVHVFDQLAARGNGTREALARERRQADTLNDMLPALGCPKVDIDAELKKPLNPALLPKTDSGSRKKHKKKLF